MNFINIFMHLKSINTFLTVKDISNGQVWKLLFVVIINCKFFKAINASIINKNMKKTIIIIIVIIINNK